MKLLFILFFVSSCSCYNLNTIYGLDGKAFSWCKAEKTTKKLCKNKGGVKTYTPINCVCGDGTEFLNYKD